MVGRGEPTPGPPIVPEGYGDFGAGGAEKLPWSQVSELLERARNYWIATTRPDERPHAAPVWGVWLGGAFYFGTDRRSRKGRNLAANPEIVVHLESGDDVVILEGVAEEVTNPDPSFVARYADAVEAKYEWRPEEAGGYVLRQRVAYAWSKFPGDATRFHFDGA